jgi:N-acetylglucosaminyldiphosphoundecaprenol N-acetyl-beta-D-mannosaminyltransferase
MAMQADAVPPRLEDAPERKRDPRIGAVPSRRVLGMRVDATSYGQAAETILDLAESGASSITCVATVHMVMEAHDSESFRKIVNTAELVTSDGMPLVWMLRALGLPQAQRVYGPDLTPVVCAEAAARGVPVGFYGASAETIDALVQSLTQRFPQLEVAFAHSPPYRSLSAEEDESVTEAIRDSGARVLFVGIGCPKQELWMAAHRERLDCSMVGVGAAFDFLAGKKAKAPAWLQRAGLEWLFRLSREPGRLWRRYAWHNSRFVALAARQLAADWGSR